MPDYKKFFIEAKELHGKEFVSQALGMIMQGDILRDIPGMDKIYPKTIDSKDLAEYLKEHGVTNYEITIDELLEKLQ